MLVVSEIVRSFGLKKVLRGVSFQQPTSSIAGLIGPSGGGKSILLKIIGHIVRSGGGTTTFDGSPNYQASLMFQEGALFDSLSVLDNVAFPLVGGKVPVATLPSALKDEVCEKSITILSRVGLASAINKMPGQLSGGMRRRVSLARAMVARPKILLLDDPTAGLDPVASSVIMNLIVEFHQEYRPTLLMVSHDLRRLLPILEHVFALFNGKIMFSGRVSDLTHADTMLQSFVSCRYDFKGSTSTATAQRENLNEQK